MLVVKGLLKKYQKKTVLNNLDIVIQKNCVYGLVGPNGTGKSSFFKILVGLVKKNSGDIIFEGRSLDRKSMDNIAYMPPEDFFYNWMTVKDAVDYYDDFFDDFKKQKALILINEMELGLNQKISTLSTGQKGRLKIILTLSRNVSLYLIDEPLNGLDPISRSIVIDTIGKEKLLDRTFIISTHIIDELETIMNRLIMFKDGKVFLNDECSNICQRQNMSLSEYYKTVY